MLKIRHLMLCASLGLFACVAQAQNQQIDIQNQQIQKAMEAKRVAISKKLSSTYASAFSKRKIHELNYLTDGSLDVLYGRGLSFKSDIVAISGSQLMGTEGRLSLTVDGDKFALYYTPVVGNGEANIAYVEQHADTIIKAALARFDAVTRYSNAK